VLVSALGETLDRVSVAAARKVFVDGFMTSRDGYQLLVPQDSLSELYDQRLTGWLTRKGVQLHLKTAVRCVQGDGKKVTHIETTDGNLHEFDAVIAAVPWRQVDSVLAEPVRAALPNLAEISKIKSSPITAVHLWYDHRHAACRVGWPAQSVALQSRAARRRTLLSGSDQRIARITSW